MPCAGRACHGAPSAWHREHVTQQGYSSRLTRTFGPSCPALQAYAARGQLRRAHKYYKQLRRDAAGMARLTLANRRVFELMIESNCRVQNVKLALQARPAGLGAPGATAR